jgi:hypothetical protein
MPADVLALEDDAAPGGAHHARDGAQRRRLAGSVGADEGHDLSLVDLDVDALQRVDGAVVDIEIGDLEHHGWPPPEDDAAGAPR